MLENDAVEWRALSQKAAEAFGINATVVEDEVQRQLVERLGELYRRRLVRPGSSGANQRTRQV